MADTDDTEIHETPTQARQGDRLVWPLRVLIVSTVAAAIGLAVLLLPNLG